MLNRSDNYDRQLLAEIYDQTMTQMEDVVLLRHLIGEMTGLDILECFSGTGRILLPLLADGHRVTGIEIAPAMADRARRKAVAQELSSRLRILVCDALSEPWGDGHYDVVIVGANSLFELATQEAQQKCIALAYRALKPGGHLFIDNNNWTSPLAESIGASWVALEGIGVDGTYCRQTATTTAVDEAAGLLMTKRTWYTRTRDGLESWEDYDTVKRPVSGAEVGEWLTGCGFKIVAACGDFSGKPFGEDSERAIYWAQK